MIVKIRFEQCQVDFKKIFRLNRFKDHFKKSKKTFQNQKTLINFSANHMYSFQLFFTKNFIDFNKT